MLGRDAGTGWKESTYPQLLLLGQKVVVLISFIQSDQDVLEPVPHAQGEFSQLGVQAGGDVWGPKHKSYQHGPRHSEPEGLHAGQAPLPTAGPPPTAASVSGLGTVSGSALLGQLLHTTMSIGDSVEGRLLCKGRHKALPLV